MKIGLYFGSFNPIHMGHMIIANHIVEHTDIEKLWLVVTPHNPHKNKKSLAGNYDRLHLVNLSIDGNDKLKASDIEFSLPKPSYTIDTMTHLAERYPQHEFSLVMGGDNLATLHKWKNYEKLINNYHIYVYKRPTHDVNELAEHPNISLCDAPMMDISSSYIRKLIREKKSIKYLVADSVYEYLQGVTIYNNLEG